MDGGVIIGTAGHIDHGKSLLVEALTGRRMDRLAEERRRGITIDLGFAPFPIGDGRAAGVVDVPGHEDFVRTMVAGATGVDLALLVVAADEGIMPQTVEHLLILEHLGVPAGIPVITKTDLVEPDWLELVTADVVERLRQSRVVFEGPARVSARTGDGIVDLAARIRARLAALPPRGADDLFRLPVDRAFSVPGVGTVVTGTCWSGSVAVGDQVRLLPPGVQGRVRSTEMHGTAAEVRPGARTAIGLAGLERQAVSRGDVAVAAADPWQASRAVDVRLTLDGSAPRPLSRRQRIRFLHGTGEWVGWAIPRAPIAPGTDGLARLRLDREVITRGGDRFVVRTLSPARTIGGGEVLDPAPPARAPWPEGLDARDPAARLAALVTRRRHGLAVSLVPVVLGESPAQSGRIGEALRGVVRLGEHLIAEATLEELAARAAERARAFHRAQPAEAGMPLESLRQGLRAPDWLAEAAIARADAAGDLSTAEALVRARGFRPGGGASPAQVEAVVAALEAGGLAPPTTDELGQSLRRSDVGASLRAAAAAGRVEAVERDRYYARSALDAFVSVLGALGGAGEFTVGDVRDRTGLSRKYLIPLLEWADARGWTERRGDRRRFRGRTKAG